MSRARARARVDGRLQQPARGFGRGLDRADDGLGRSLARRLRRAGRNGARRRPLERRDRQSGQNEELDYDTNDRKNSFQDGSGNLVIRALKEQFVDAQGVQSSQPFTSARLNTQDKVEQTYGRFEARIKLPAGGKGVWPAFWPLGQRRARHRLALVR